MLFQTQNNLSFTYPYMRPRMYPQVGAWVGRRSVIRITNKQIIRRIETIDTNLRNVH